MYQLVYRSVANDNISFSDIHDILHESREFNKQHEITGCLLFFNNEFVQILEGEKEIVNILFEKINKDPRHNYVMLLNEEETEERIFENWNMAFLNLDDENLKEQERALFIKNFVITANISEKPNHTVRLFWHVVKELLKPWSLG